LGRRLLLDAVAALLVNLVHAVLDEIRLRSPSGVQPGLGDWGGGVVGVGLLCRCLA
jgi:hypothetical protein